MPILRINNYVDVYKLRSYSFDLHSMAARDGRQAVTEFVNEEILERIAPKPSDVLVDVGCGDGCLLKKADYIRTRIGTVGSQDERDRLQKEIPDVNFKASLIHSLPLEAASADVVVCNAVFLYLQTTEYVEKALCELARIAKPNGKVWIGEIPTVDEYAKYRMYCGNSVIGLLWYLLRRHGVRTFLGMVRKLAKSTFGKEQFVLNSAGLYYAAPEDFVHLAKKCGLSLESHFKHRELDAAGKIKEVDHRFNYMFRKPAA